jgi:hypothetical protein
MGQGIKGIFGVKAKVAITIMLLMFVFSISYLTCPIDALILGNIAGRDNSIKLIKSSKYNNYYVSFLAYKDDTKVTKLKCTKKQYDFIIKNEEEYYIFYSTSLFNHKAGRIVELDDEPIYFDNGKER